MRVCCFAVSMSWVGELSVGGKQPPERRAHSSAVVGLNIYIFGGESSLGVTLSDLHVFDTEKLVRDLGEEEGGGGGGVGGPMFVATCHGLGFCWCWL
jgi:hypothetical protein